MLVGFRNWSIFRSYPVKQINQNIFFLNECSLANYSKERLLVFRNKKHVWVKVSYIRSSTHIEVFTYRGPLVSRLERLYETNRSCCQKYKQKRDNKPFWYYVGHILVLQHNVVGYICLYAPTSNSIPRPSLPRKGLYYRRPLIAMTVKFVWILTLDIHIGLYSEYYRRPLVAMTVKFVWILTLDIHIGLYSECQCEFTLVWLARL